jgi:hypothetical protein
VTFDLIAWPVDRALTYEEAVAEVGRFGGAAAGPGHDQRLDPFLARLEHRYPGIRGQGPVAPPFELDVRRGHVAIGIPWGQVEAVVADISEAAWTTGLAILDPQREALGLPAPFAAAPLTSEGLERHVRAAEDAFAAIQRGGAQAAGGDDATVRRAVSGELAAAGYRQLSPSGHDITPEVADERLADPSRTPASLQTPEHKARLIADLVSPTVGARHVALTQLAGWDPDPEVADALRPMLASEDVFEAGQAAQGLARQGDVTDLPGVLDLVHRMSPADGGTVESMLLPLRAALQLAALAGPMAVDGVRARARAWRGQPKARRQSWERELDQEIEGLLDEG